MVNFLFDYEIINEVKISLRDFNYIKRCDDFTF